MKGKAMQRISSIGRTKEIIEKYKFRFSKSLGQNFLVDGNTIDKIIRSGGIGPGDNVLEVGPGIGTLTQMLCQEAGKVVAIEKDRALIPILKNDTLKDCENLTVLHGDILKEDIRAITSEYFGTGSFKLVANLPYYITTPIIMRFLEEDLPVTDILVMIQKEVAERIEALPGSKSYGALSVAVQYYAEPQIMGIVPKHVFMPSPKVDSIIIRLKVRQEPPVKLLDKKLFFQTVKASFAMRRKTLYNSLRKNLPYGQDTILQALKSSAIEPKRRGETLSIEEFATLSNEIYKLIN